MRPRRALLILALTLIAAALAGCSPAGDGTEGDGAGSGAADVRAQVEPIYREAAECIRTHGYPEFPDPVIADDGTVAELPENVQRILEQRKATLEPACQPILDRLPASVREAQEGGHTATPEEVAMLRRFAACMRQHGVPDWPDPGSDGRFPMTDQFAREGKSPRIVNGFRSCEDLNPDPNHRLSFSGAPKK